MAGSDLVLGHAIGDDLADVDSAIKAGALWGWELRSTTGTATVAIGAAENGTAGNRPSMTLSDEK